MFISFSETWLDCDTPDGVISIPGYRVHRRDRCGHGEGVAIYSPDGSKGKGGEDLERVNLEANWIEFGTSRKKPLLVCIIIVLRIVAVDSLVISRT